MAIAKAEGDWGVRGADLDTIFSTRPTDDRVVDSLSRAQAKFHPSFPGWPLYRRLLLGDPLLDRQLDAYAVGLARALSRARQRDGQDFVPRRQRGLWIAQAGRDGLHCALFGKYPETAVQRAEQYKTSDALYHRIRSVVAGGIVLGAESFASEARAEYCRLLREEV